MLKNFFQRAILKKIQKAVINAKNKKAKEAMIKKRLKKTTEINK